MPIQLTCADAGYRLPDGIALFTSLNFSLSTIKTGIVGSNGAGKTTLLELLAGIRKPSEGIVTGDGPVSYLRQLESFEPSETVAGVLGVRAVLEAHSRIAGGVATAKDYDLMDGRWQLPELADRTMKDLGAGHIPMDRQARHLSGGELTRIRFARVLIEEPDFLLLDEPTNHLDLSGREFVYNLIDSWVKGLVVVSHDRKLLSLLDQIAELGPLGLKFYGGNWDFFRGQRDIEKTAAEQDLASARATLAKARQTAQRAHERQERRSSSGRKRATRTGMPKMQMGNLKRKAEGTTSRLAGRHEAKVNEARSNFYKAKRRLPSEEPIHVDLKTAEIPKTKRMIELIEVNYVYPGSDRLLWNHNLNLSIFGRERIWLKGANGSGKSTLLDIILRRKEPTNGEIRTGTGHIGILDQPVSVLADDRSVLENIGLAAPGRTAGEIRSLAGRFGFRSDSSLKKAGWLSGGERMRAGLACLLGAAQAPEILMLDEPANNLDLSSLSALVSALTSFESTLIVVSHDITFVEEIRVDRGIDLTAPYPTLR
ncbi:MAG TPA: ABC-F family ATP-binding cassette domain-containing protein [Blastocatellia bacterium]